MWIPQVDDQARTSYPHPVAIVGVDPLSAPCKCVQIPYAYLPLVVGALTQLVNPATWDPADESARLAQLEQVEELIAMIALGEGCEPLPPSPPVPPEGEDIDCKIASYIVGYVARQLVDAAIDRALGEVGWLGKLVDLVDKIPGAVNILGLLGVYQGEAVDIINDNPLSDWLEMKASDQLWDWIGCMVYSKVQGVHGFTQPVVDAIKTGLDLYAEWIPGGKEVVQLLFDALGAVKLNALAEVADLTTYDCSGCGNETPVITGTGIDMSRAGRLELTDGAVDLLQLSKLTVENMLVSGTPDNATLTPEPLLSVSDGVTTGNGIDSLVFDGGAVSVDEGTATVSGLQGPTGPSGATGATGPTGPQGEKGDQGLMGLIGPIGLTGPQGEKGEKGDPGDPASAGVNIALNEEDEGLISNLILDDSDTVTWEKLSLIGGVLAVKASAIGEYPEGQVVDAIAPGDVALTQNTWTLLFGTTVTAGSWLAGGQALFTNGAGAQQTFRLGVFVDGICLKSAEGIAPASNTLTLAIASFLFEVAAEATVALYAWTNATGSYAKQSDLGANGNATFFTCVVPGGGPQGEQGIQGPAGPAATVTMHWLGTDVTLTNDNTTYDLISFSLDAGTYLLTGFADFVAGTTYQQASVLLTDNADSILAAGVVLQMTNNQDTSGSCYCVVSPVSTSTYKLRAYRKDGSGHASMTVSAAQHYGLTTGNIMTGVVVLKLA